MLLVFLSRHKTKRKKDWKSLENWNRRESRGGGWVSFIIISTNTYLKGFHKKYKISFRPFFPGLLLWGWLAVGESERAVYHKFRFVFWFLRGQRLKGCKNDRKTCNGEKKVFHFKNNKSEQSSLSESLDLKVCCISVSFGVIILTRFYAFLVLCSRIFAKKGLQENWEV